MTRTPEAFSRRQRTTASTASWARVYRGMPRRVTSQMAKKVAEQTASCTRARGGAWRKVRISPPSTSMGARMPPRWILSNI